MEMLRDGWFTKQDNTMSIFNNINGNDPFEALQGEGVESPGFPSGPHEGLQPIDIQSPFGEESVFHITSDLANISESINDNEFFYKVILLKSGTEVFEHYASESTEDTPLDKQLLIYYETESADTSNLFGTACRVKMGVKRTALMKSLLKGKRRISVNGDNSEASDLEAWAKRIAVYEKKIDHKVLLNAVKLELIGSADKDSFFKTFLNLNNYLADLMISGVEGIEDWKFTKENYEYGIKDYKPIIPVKIFSGKEDYITTGSTVEDTIPNIGIAKLKNLSENLDAIVLNALKATVRSTPTLVDDIGFHALEEYWEKFLPENIKRILDKIKGLIRRSEAFVDEMAKAIEEELAMMNAFLCGLINGILSLVQSIIAILAFVIDNFQLLELERLSKENLNAQQQKTEFVEDLIDLLLDNVEEIFKGMLSLVLTLPGDLLRLGKYIGEEIKGLSKYFWAFFIGAVVFEVILDIILAFLTGGTSLAVKAATKISRAATILAKQGVKVTRKTAQQIAKRTGDLLAFIRKEIENLIDALKSGKLTSFIEDKIDEFFDLVKRKGPNKGLRKSQLNLSENLVKRFNKTRIIQNVENLDELYIAARKANSELIAKTKVLASKTGGKSGFRPKSVNNGLKSKDRALEKINGDYGGKPQFLVDISGSKVVYNNVDELYRALEEIANSKLVEIVRFKDRFIKPVHGYRDILMNLKMSNGHIVEFRLHIKAMDKAAETGHKIYLQIRTLEALSDARKLTLTEQIKLESLLNREFKLYEKAWEEIIKL